MVGTLSYNKESYFVMIKQQRSLVSRIQPILLFLLLIGYTANSLANQTINVGYSHRIPYQYSKINEGGLREILGLDIHLLNSIYNQINQDIHYIPIQWSKLSETMQQKKIDLVSGVYKTPQREKFAYFSKPYRTETDRLYMRKKEIRYYHFKTLKRLFTSSSMRFLKIGAIAGYNYSDETINQYLKNPRYPKNVVLAENNLENLNNLLTKKIDLFFDDEIEMERLIGGKQSASKNRTFPNKNQPT